MTSWAERLTGVRGVLLDISGVLYDSGAGGGAAIAGSVEAVARLVSSTYAVPSVATGGGAFALAPPSRALALLLMLARNQVGKVELVPGLYELEPRFGSSWLTCK